MAHSSYDVPWTRWSAALAVVLLLAGCGTDASSSGAPGRMPGGHRHDVPAASPPPNAPQARALLERLVVRPRPHGTQDYQRDAFGSDWVDTDHNGCNQRDDVLLRDAVPGTVRIQRQGACDHDMLAGTWHDPYTGRTLVFTDLKDLRQAEAVQIDHVVPLAEAWVSAARSWTKARREVFANDLDELLAVDGPTNAAKGDDDPAAWRPRLGFQCAYARRWITVKSRYSLSVDPPEKGALAEMLDTCR
jgi:hypothetical protein